MKTKHPFLAYLIIAILAVGGGYLWFRSAEKSLDETLEIGQDFEQ